ncbi:MAG: PorP/SprF family type IX secretion system membrane protein [Cytophagaceae bacterium]|jgi:type IX secretion system PorP/SprF family membrane protein|nr:PorP/SprF family type IX secretion system membrane protein [Cytophagaceae bacterium]
MASALLLKKKCSFKSRFSSEKAGFNALENKKIRRFIFFKLFWAGRFVFFALFCDGISNVEAQVTDKMLSQYMHNSLSFNPAYAGMTGKMNAAVVDRHQWTGMEGYPHTTFISGDMSLNILGTSGGVGLMFFNETVGYYSNLLIEGFFSRIFDMGEGKLGAGFNFGVVNVVSDGAKLIPVPEDAQGENKYHIQDDPLIPGVEVNGIGFDLGVGVYYQTPKYYAGISVLHLFQPEPDFKDEANMYIPRTLYITAGYNYAFWERPVVLKPSFIIMKSASIWQFTLSTVALFKDKYWGGLSYRYQGDVSVMVGLELPNGLKVGYCFDVPANRVAIQSSGTHEVMIGYSFDISLGKRNKRYKNVRFL